MANFEEIRAQLMSEKVTLRKKGRLACEQLMQRESSLQQIQTMELVGAVMSWEMRELQGYADKKKYPDKEVITFVKQVLKFCVKFGCIKSCKLSVLLQHQLDLWRDAQIPAQYKLEHIVNLTDLLEQRCFHDVSFVSNDQSVGLQEVFKYLREQMVDASSIAERKYLNLLKILCGSLFLEMPDTPRRMLRPLLRWLSSLLVFEIDNESAGLLVCMAITDCFTSVLSYFGAAVVTVVLKESGTLLSQIRRRCLSNQMKDQDIATMTGFLACLLDSCIQRNDIFQLGIEGAVKDCLPEITSLLECLLSDEFMTNFISTQRLKVNRRLNKDLFVNYLLDSKTAVYFRICALYHRVLHLVDSNSSSGSRSIDRDTSCEANAKKRARVEEIGVTLDNIPATLLKKFSDRKSVDSKDIKGLHCTECLCFYLTAIVASSKPTNSTKQAFLCDVIRTLTSVVRSLLQQEDRQLLGSLFFTINAVLSTLSTGEAPSTALLVEVSQLQREVLMNEQRLLKILAQTCASGTVTEQAVMALNELMSIDTMDAQNMVKKFEVWPLLLRHQDGTSPAYALLLSTLVKRTKGTGTASSLRRTISSSSEETQHHAKALEIQGQWITALLTRYTEGSSLSGAVVLTTHHVTKLLSSYYQSVCRLFQVQMSATAPVSDWESVHAKGLSPGYPAQWHMDQNLHWFLFEDSSPDYECSTTLDKLLTVVSAASSSPFPYQVIQQHVAQWINVILSFQDRLVEAIESEGISQELLEAPKGMINAVVLLLTFVTAIILALDKQEGMHITTTKVHVREIFWVLTEKCLQYLKSKLSSNASIDFTGKVVSHVVSLWQCICRASLLRNGFEGGMEDVVDLSFADKVHAPLRGMLSFCIGSRGDEHGGFMDGAATAAGRPASRNGGSRDDFDDDDLLNTFSNSQSMQRHSSTNSLNASNSGNAHDSTLIVKLQAGLVELLMSTLPPESSFHTIQDSRYLSVRKSFGTEASLRLAEYLVSYRRVECLQHVINQSMWHRDWNHLGYMKVLNIIQSIVSSAWFWTGIKGQQIQPTYATAYQHFYEDFVLKLVEPPEDDSLLVGFANRSAEVRIAKFRGLVGILQRADDLSDLKTQVRMSFLAALTDASLPLRIVAAQHVGLLFRVFKKKDSVFRGIVDKLPHRVALADAPVGGAAPPLFADALEAAIVAKTLACISCDQMANADFPHILLNGLQELLELYVLLLPRQAQLTSDDPNFALRVLLYSFDEVATSIGYISRHELLQELLPVILTAWIHGDSGISGTSEVSESEAIMRLRSFPAMLFFAQNHNNLSINDGETAPFNQQKAFFTEYRCEVISTIVEIVAPRKRWHYLLAFCAVMDVEPTDRVIATFVRESLSHLKAVEIWAMLKDTAMRPDLEALRLPERAASMNDFVNRMVNSGDQITLLRGQVTSFVCQALLVEVGRVVLDHQSAIAEFQPSSELLASILKAGAQSLGLDSTAKLLAQCNLFYVATWLHHRLRSSHHLGSHLHILAALLTLLQEYPLAAVDSAITGMIFQMLSYSVSTYPAAIIVVTKIVLAFSKTLKASLENVNPSKDTSSMGYIQQEDTSVRILLSEGILLWNYLKLHTDMQVDDVDPVDNRTNLVTRVVHTYYAPRPALTTPVDIISRMEDSLFRAVQTVLAAWEKARNNRHGGIANTVVANVARSLLPLAAPVWPQDYALETKETSVREFLQIVRTSVALVCEGLAPASTLLLQLVAIENLLRDPVSAKHCEAFNVGDFLLHTSFVTKDSNLSALSDLALHLLVRVTCDWTSLPVRTQQSLTCTETLRPNDLQRTILEEKILMNLQHHLVAGGECFQLAQQALSNLQSAMDLKDQYHHLQPACIERVIPPVRMATNFETYLPQRVIHDRQALLNARAHHIDIFNALQAISEDSRQEYVTWICRIAFTLTDWLRSIRGHIGSPSASSRKSKASNGSSSSNAHNPTKILSFLDHVQGMMLTSPAIAECAFPVLVTAVYDSFGQESIHWKMLLRFLTECMLGHRVLTNHAVTNSNGTIGVGPTTVSTDRPVDSKVVKLACYACVMIVRKYLDAFMDEKQSFFAVASASRSFASSSRGGAGLDQQVKISFPRLPYGPLAQTATVVGFHYTALFFVEIARDLSLLKDGDRAQLPVPTSGTSSAAASSSLLPGNEFNYDTEAINYTAMSHRIDFLSSLFQKLDNPDAVEGLDITSNLQLQCLHQMNRGHYLEAIASAESMLVSHNNRQDYCFAEQAVSTALSGLGCSYTNSQRQQQQQLQTAETLGQQARASLQTWDISSSGLGYTDNELGSVSSASSPFMMNTSCRRLEVLSSLLATTSTSAVNKHQLPETLRNLRQDVLQSLTLLRGDESRTQMCQDVSIYAQVSQVLQIVERAAASSSTVSGGVVQYHQTHREPTSAAARLELDTLESNLLHNFRMQLTPQQATYTIELTKLLLQVQVIQVERAVKLVGDMVDLACTFMSSDRQAHALSPVFYNFWQYIRLQGPQPQHHLNAPLPLFNKASHPAAMNGHGVEINADILAALHLQESVLLWSKGFRQAAMSKLRLDVIAHFAQLTRDVLATNASGNQNSNSRGRGATTAAATAATPMHQSPASVFSRSTSALAMLTAGQWMSATGASSPDALLQEFFTPAVRLAQDAQVTVRAHRSVGDFCAVVYEHIRTRLRSVEWKRGERILKDREAELRDSLDEKAAAKKAGNVTQQDEVALSRHINMLKKEIDMDRKERDRVVHSRDQSLQALLHHYSQVLLLSPQAEEGTVFKLVSYWLSNAHRASVSQAMRPLVQNVATYKIVPLHYQIFSRLGTRPQVPREDEDPVDGEEPPVSQTTAAVQNNSHVNAADLDAGEFQETLQRLVTRMCSDHPYQTLPQLFALLHEGIIASQVYLSNTSATRSMAADAVYQTLLATPSVTKTASSMKTLLLRYIELANTKTTEMEKKQKLKGIFFKEVQPRGQRFHEVLATVPEPPMILTQSVDVRPLCDYSDVLRTAQIVETFDITENGISRPKIISVRGSDGHLYKQLVKGGDDMRQDAVMEQVFANLNSTLQQNVTTKQRHLKIRTYKVIPTSPQTGVLEWVENTEPFGAILCDSNSRQGLHSRYYPHDLSHRECREMLHTATGAQEKDEKFAMIVENFHPAFRFFFLEQFAGDPIAWAQAKLQYTRSVATNSMAGYVLGVGDRHAQNILVDKLTGEVVHIDFGIVFEQGRILSIPETVPFRLTRDIVDGMGLTGVEGSFRRCCEEVLQVLRANSSKLMTILEVVIHDPLYRWSLSPQKARQRQLQEQQQQQQLQQRGRQSRNGGDGQQQTHQNPQRQTFSKDAAERVLQRIQHKLRGYEDPTGDALAVDAQVDLLITAAKNPAHLSKIFAGWSPWL